MKGKNKIKKLQREFKGITLIALVVTIIVLLILSSVAISLTIGNNGIFTRAQNAVKEYGEDKVTWLDDVPVPDGFYYAGGSKDKGLVISDSDLDKKEYTEENKNGEVSTDLQGNQFVWVPVSDEQISQMFVNETVELNGVTTTTDVYSNLTIRDEEKTDYTSGKPGNKSSVSEPDVLSEYDTKSEYADIILGTSGTGNAEELAKVFVKDYKAMSDSIKKYKGFYIGRYELTGTVDAPTEKKGSVLSAKKTGNWYYLYKACKGFTKENVTSTMIYGVQWDATMEWLKQTKFAGKPEEVDTNSSSWGNYSGSLKYTGTEGYEANKIYDLAGNYREWTQEVLSTICRVTRGGDYNFSGFIDPASDRDYSNPSRYDSNYSSRTTLIIQ